MTTAIRRLPKKAIGWDMFDENRSVTAQAMGENQVLMSVNTGARSYMVSLDRDGARHLLDGLVDFLAYRKEVHGD